MNQVPKVLTNFLSLLNSDVVYFLSSQWEFLMQNFKFELLKLQRKNRTQVEAFHDHEQNWNGILFCPTLRKKYSSDQEKLLKFEAEDWEFAKILRILEQFIWTLNGQNNVW